MKTKLMHVRINVSDVNASLKWYEEVLGFERQGCWPRDNPTYFDFVSDAGAGFSIMEIKGEKSHGRLNFTVSNVDKLWDKLKDKVQVLEPLFDTPYGTRKFTICDLDGNELGFCQE